MTRRRFAGRRNGRAVGVPRKRRYGSKNNFMYARCDRRKKNFSSARRHGRKGRVNNLRRHLRMGRGAYGGISVLLSVVLFAFTIMACLLIDIARVDSARNQAARALDIAALSVLSGYDAELKNGYGLFALHMPYPDVSVLQFYLEKNLSVNTINNPPAIGGANSRNGLTARLYDFRIEGLSLETRMPISDIDIIERQILEYMKYRAPASLASGVGDFFSQAGAASKMAGAAKAKAEIDGKLARIGREQQNLRDYIYGDTHVTGTGNSFILNYGKNAEREELKDEIIGLYSDFVGSGDKDTKKDLRNAFDKLIDAEVGSYLNANRNAAASASEISKISAELWPLYAELDDSLNEIGAGESETRFINTMIGAAEKDKASLLNADGAAEIIDSLNSNADALSRTAERMKNLKNEALGHVSGAAPINEQDFNRRLSPDTPGYSYKVSYDYRKTSSAGKMPDPREYADIGISNLLFGKNENEKKLSDIVADIGRLPSRRDPASRAPPTISYLGASETGKIGYDPFDGDSGFTERALSGVAGVSGILSEGGEALRDKLYVGEYVLGVFGNHIGERYRWAGSSGLERTSFFESEAEYILHGNDKQSGNVFWTKLQLLLTRFALNYIHVYSDPRKTDFAYNCAAALTSWFSSGALVPAAANLIIAAWCIKESIEDVHDLLDGDRIPLIKLAGDWKTNIGVDSAGQPKTDENIKWSYLDYLRIFLLMQTKQNILARICDLIEVNAIYSGRELLTDNLYCAIDCGLDASVNYLFMTASFMPERFKTAQNRRRLGAKTFRDLF